MKALTIIFFLGLFTISNVTSAAEPARSYKNLQQEDRAVGSFRGIAAGGSLTVKVTMGDKESVRLEGDEDAIAELITEVKKDILIIRPRTKWNDWSRRYKNASVTVYITARRLSSLTMSGSGSMSVANSINTSELVATLSGSGSIKATTNCRSFVGVISGSGSLNINGEASDSNLTLSGSGSFAGKGFSTQKLSAQISGSANIYIRAENNIEAVISGSGSILYTGDPKIQKTVIGSGSIRKVKSSFQQI